MQSCEKKSILNTNKKNNLNEIDRLIDLGDNYLEKTKYDSAFYYHNKAKTLCNPRTDNTRIIYSLGRMSEIQQNQGDYYGSETTATEAVPYLNKSIDPSYECSIYNLLGIVNVKLFDYENALFYYNKVLVSKTDAIRKLRSKQNTAVVFMAMKDYNRAIEILLPLSLKKEVVNDSLQIKNVLDNLGYSYFKVGNNTKGIYYLNRALKIKERLKDDWGMASSYLHLSNYYKESNSKLSNKYAQLGYVKATKVNNVDDRLEALALLIQTSTENKSKNYSEKYIQLNDSITKARQKAKNQFAKIKYDSKKEKEENQLLKTQKAENALQLEEQKNRNLILYFIAAMGIAATTFISFYLISKNKREKIKTSYDTEIRIAKKLHDELANDVFHTMAFAETQDLSSNQNKEILLNNLDTIYSRTRNISKENSIIDTGLQFVSGLKEMMSKFNSEAINVLVNGMDDIDWDTIENNKKIVIYRVLQELLVNMKKHSQCSLSVISFKNIEKKIQVNYSDNGLGADMETIISKKGLQNVENRILAINGNFTFDTKPNKGFKISLTIPT
jgi:signal transduction histidine kinase